MAANTFNPNDYQSRKGFARRESIECPILFFDIVGFSKDMNNERAQKVVSDMQKVMWDVLEPHHYWAEKAEYAANNDLLLIPTGDGYGIATDPKQMADEEILKIAAQLQPAFAASGINVRMGISKGRNVVTIDLNENVNIFGYGIVLATRVCNAAADGQILVHSDFAESLLQDRAIPALSKIGTPFDAKHGLKLNCHNYFSHGLFGRDATDHDENKENPTHPRHGT